MNPPKALPGHNKCERCGKKRGHRREYWCGSFVLCTECAELTARGAMDPECHPSVAGHLVPYKRRRGRHKHGGAPGRVR